MNDRIRELAEQAELNLELQSLKVEKFAELIVREGAQFIEDKFDFCGDELIIAEKLKEHFGVES